MTTQQTERELFEQLAGLSVRERTRNSRGDYLVTSSRVLWLNWQVFRAPLLSRIAELEKQLDTAETLNAAHTMATAHTNDYIDALSKDAERLDWMIFHSATVFHANDGEFCWVEWGLHETKFYDNAREAIDAAISAREGE